MADEIKWIKITTGIFDNKKMKQIDAMPDADAVMVIWFKLLCLAGAANEQGYLLLTDSLAYSEEMLANEFRRPINTVRFAISAFEKLGMIELDTAPENQQFIRVKNWEKYQNIDGMEKIREQARQRMAKMRENLKTIGGKSKSNVAGYVTGDVTVTQGYALEREREIEKEITLSAVTNNDAVDNLIQTLQQNGFKIINDRDIKTVKGLLSVYSPEQIEQAIAQSRTENEEYVSAVAKILKGGGVAGGPTKRRPGTVVSKDHKPDYSQSL